MNICVKRFLRYVCLAAALHLVVKQVCSFLNADIAGRQRGRGVRQQDNTPMVLNTSCRALFTVTDVSELYAPNASLFIQNHYGYASPNKHSVDWRGRQYLANSGGADAAGAVQQLLLKRDSPSGASTTDYSPLAALLPSVLGFQGEGEGSSPVVTTTTRIGAAGGLLPYVPCEIATYADPALVTSCFKNRLARQDFFWICFMGDSKIRSLFYEFLYRSDDELHYMMKLPNGSMPFSAMDREHMKLKLDMEARSTKLFGLLVSFQFRAFYDEKTMNLRNSSELRQLTQWAKGRETPPHLFVLGYTSWATLDMQAVYVQDALSTLTDIHEVVAPLLQKISLKTRVIVTSQSRYKIYAGPGQLQFYSMPYGDPTYDWSEAVLLHHLQLHSQYRKARPPFGTPDALSEPEAEVVEPRLGRRGSRPRDHLVPEVDDGGVWWWDTSLPLSLAESSECEELYNRGLSLHPMYKSYFFKCNDDNHAGTVTLGDQVTMLLNLMCNTVLGTREELCCS